MNKDDQDRIKKLLQQAMPPVKGESEPRRDLWPAMLRRLNARPAATTRRTCGNTVCPAGW